MLNAEQFPKIIRDIERKYRSVYYRLPLLVGNEAVNFVLDNFRLQGFMGNTFQKWVPRKSNTWGKRDRRGAAILIGTGRLRRSWRITRLGRDFVAVGSDVKYAKAHNYGLRMESVQTVKGYTRKSGSFVSSHERRINMRLPKRQMIGDSPYLRARLKRIAMAAFLKEMRYLKP